MIFTGVEGTFTTPRVRYKDFNDSIGSAILIFTYGLMSHEATRVKIYVYVRNIQYLSTDVL